MNAIYKILEKTQVGLDLAMIDRTLFFIVVIRFIILSIKYNLKTSFYITCISLFAGYLWYRHLIDLIFTYRNILLEYPFLYKLGLDGTQLRSSIQSETFVSLKSRENANWYNPGQILYYALMDGMIDFDPEKNIRYYIDPLSMFISNLSETRKSKIHLVYYSIYNTIIPNVFNVLIRFWTQLSGLALYAVVTRIGKRYCPYLIRWHWTFLILVGLFEQIFMSLIFRLLYYQSFVLYPKIKIYYSNDDLILQSNFINTFVVGSVIIHIGSIFFGLFHAIWGQYFYMPVFVKNTELHIGPRWKTSIYSGGYTSWQDEKTVNSKFPKIWYGWFGRGTSSDWNIINKFKKFFRSIVKNIKKNFKK